MSQESEKAGPYLTVEKAAARLKVEPGTLAKWRHLGKGPAWRDHGKIVYHIDDLNDWSLARRRTEITKKREGTSGNDGGAP